MAVDGESAMAAAAIACGLLLWGRRSSLRVPYKNLQSVWNDAEDH